MAEPELPGPLAGAGVVRVAWAGTGVLVATSAAAALVPDTFGSLHAVLSCILFAVGTAALLWAYARGITRSRTDDVTLAGLFFLSGDAAPDEVRRPLRIALVVEVVAVVVAASVRPYTVVAFGILAPMFGIGLMGAWGARHGRFGPRRPKDPT